MNLPAQPRPQEGPLGCSTLLRQVFGYIGRGQSCFLRVNAQWNDIYVQLFGAKTTYDAAVASVARVEVAAAEGCPLTIKLFSKAAESGNIGVCMKLKSLSCPCSDLTCYAAATGGHLKLLRWLREGPDPCPWRLTTCMAAARGGHMELLQWLRAGADPCPWSVDSCLAAAEGGHLEILQWLRGGTCPCPWYEDVCLIAARGGHLEMLKWLREGPDPCPWNEDTCEAAANGGHLEVLKWLREGPDVCPWNGWCCPAWTAREHPDHFSCNFDYGEDSEQFTSIVNWVHANGHPCDCS
ncbi:unnamed protein product [Chrysoparadoxa australica]